MFTVTVTVADPQLEKFAKHYESVLNDYLAEHPEVAGEIEREIARRVRNIELGGWEGVHWGPGAVEYPQVEVLPPFLAVSSGESAVGKVEWIDLSVPIEGEGEGKEDG
jgi:hypothetical protein